MSKFLCIISIFHNFCWCPNSHTGVRKSATYAGVRIRTLVCEKKNSRRQRANEIILYAFERIEFLYEKIGFDRYVVSLLVTRL